MDTVFWAVVGLAVGVGLIALYNLYKDGGRDALLSPEARDIIYDVAESILKFYDVKDDFEKILDVAALEARRRIEKSSLPQSDKDFLTEDNIKRALRPILTFLRDKKIKAMKEDQA